MKESGKHIRYSLKQCTPVIPGYIFLGIAFGLMLQNAGYHVIWAFAISLFVYAGSMQMVMVSLLLQNVGLLYAAFMTFLINGRHIFYGLSFVDKYRNMGRKYPYMIFSLTDETYSVLCGLSIPEELEEKTVMFYISLFNHFFWILGSVIGGVAGHFITFEVRGIDFSMTALFIVIVLEQWKVKRNRFSVLLGFFLAFVCLLLIGPDGFMLPALTITVLLLIGSRRTVLRKAHDRKEDKGEVLNEN